MSITVTITDTLQTAGAQAATDAYNAAQPQDTPAITAQEYLQQVLERACMSYREQYAVDRVTSGAFVLRFTQAEYDAIKAASATDEVISGFLARIDVSAYVWLGSAEVQQAMAYVVSQGLLTQARADAILDYSAQAPGT